MKQIGKLKVLQRLSDYEFGVELWVMREGLNRNKWDYRNIERHYLSFLGTPILCAFPNGNIGDGHNMKEKRDAKTGASYYSFLDGTSERIVGTISDDPNDLYITEADGQKWLVAKGRLFTFYAKELVDNIISNGVMEVSAETEVRESFNEGNAEVFTEWIGLGVTILGDGVAPAIPNARIEELAAMRDEFNSVCLKAASYRGNKDECNECGDNECKTDKCGDNECGDNECKTDKCGDNECKDAECKSDECKTDKCGDNECKSDECGYNECKDNETGEECDDDGLIDESDEVPEETYDKPHNSENKGVRKMTLSKKQLAELAPKFDGYTILAAEQTEDSIQVCLMSATGDTCTYEMESLDDVVSPNKIVSCNAQVGFAFGETEVRVDACEMLDTLSATIITTNSELDKAKDELETANNTIKSMRDAEEKRRVNAAKEVATATLEAFNANRMEKVSEDVLAGVKADIESGVYTNSVNAEGEWVGDADVKNIVLAKCAESVMDMDKISAQKRDNQYIWDRVQGGKSEDDGTLGSLLASLDI